VQCENECGNARAASATRSSWDAIRSVRLDDIEREFFRVKAKLHASIVLFADRDGRMYDS
jgi:hypothetical protein